MTRLALDERPAGGGDGLRCASLDAYVRAERDITGPFPIAAVQRAEGKSLSSNEKIV